MKKDFLINEAKLFFEQAVEERRFFHENPELSSAEVVTSAYLKNEAKKLGYTIEAVMPDKKSKGLGFTAVLDTGRPGKSLAIRTDMDALPINENANNLKNKRKCISKIAGVMHACGHDGHMAITLAVMRIVKKNEQLLNGKIYFVFEEGEEKSTGIDAMVKHLMAKKIDAIYGNHLCSDLETGKISVTSGAVTASSLRIQMNIHGKGGHASRPDKAINPIFAAAYILTNLAGAWANQMDRDHPVTLGFTQIYGSEARNIIADDAFLGGSLRYYDEEAGKHAFEVIQNVACSVAKAHKCSVEFSEDSGPSATSVINDARLAKLGQDIVTKYYSEGLLDSYVWSASESFGKYSRKIPSLMTLIGIKNECEGTGAAHHNEYFDIDEQALFQGILVESAFVFKFLS